MFEIEVAVVPGLRNRIKDLRNEAGLSQEQLGELIGVEHSTIQRLESGNQKLTDHYMQKIANALRVHPAELIIENEVIARNAQERQALELLRQMGDDVIHAWLETGKHLVPKK